MVKKTLWMLLRLLIVVALATIAFILGYAIYSGLIAFGRGTWAAVQMIWAFAKSNWRILTIMAVCLVIANVMLVYYRHCIDNKIPVGANIKRFFASIGRGFKGFFLGLSKFLLK